MDMKTISVICEKGGTGKTMIASELHAAFTRQGYRTSLYSLDGQYAKGSQGKKAEDPEIAVVDTPGVMAGNLKDVIKGSDLVVVPVRPTPNDIEPFTRTVQVIRKNTDAPILIVVNGFNRFRMSASFLAWLKQKPWAEHVCIVPQAEAVVQAEGEDVSVHKVAPRGSAAIAIENVAATVSKLAGIPYPVSK